MEKNISILGGDKRLISLANLLAKQQYKVYTYGLEKAEFYKDTIEKCYSLQELFSRTNKVIGPIPITFYENNLKLPNSDTKINIEDIAKEMANKTFIAGKIDIETRKKLEKNNNKIIDILELEEFTILNVIPTVEGAIQVAMQETTTTLHGSYILILGFGRIGKLLAKSLNALGVNVTCEARKQKDLAWIKAYGYKGIHLENIGKYIGEFDIIFNTIPVQILDKNILKKVNKNAIIIELASAPGGVDRFSAKEENIKVVDALALPRKSSPRYCSTIH